MSRIQFPDRSTPPEKPKPARSSRQKRKRATKDTEYNAVSDIYKEQNPLCFNCRKELPPDKLETDHIVRGTAGRPASLLNSDTWINQCPECHGDSSAIEDKIVMKIINVVTAIEKLRGRRLSDEQSEKICDDFVNAMFN